MKKQLLPLLIFCAFSIGTTMAQRTRRAPAIQDGNSGSQVLNRGTRMEPCKEGPQIISISTILNNKITFVFHGINVTELQYTINGNGGRRSGVVKPTSPTITADFAALTPGNYVLTLTGINCRGTSQKMFTVPANASDNIAIPENTNTAGGRFTTTPKQYLSLSNANGVYSDRTAGDYQENGQIYRNENGRKYRAFYWINEFPYQNTDGTPKRLENVPLPPGLVVSIRKVYVDARWRNTFTGVLESGYESWYQNPSGDIDLIWKTVSASVTTTGGTKPHAGSVALKQNPAWLDAGKLVPQFFFNPAKAIPDKPVGIQSYPAIPGNPERTFAALKNAGITHVWDMSMHAQGFFNDQWQPTGKNTSGITRALMLGTQGLGQMVPGLKPYGGQLTRRQAEQWADQQQLFDGAIITDEFAEGTYPQFDQSREWFYKRLSERIATGGFKNVQLLGEYGYASQKLGISQKPLSDYALSLLTPSLVSNLETRDGSSDTKFKHYIGTAGQYRGNCVGGYYAITENVSDWIVNFAYNTIQYNATPNKPRLLFTWAGMQSNTTMIDTPQKDAGTLRPNGTVSHNFPETPPEIMKVMGFFGLLFFDSVYLWDAYGTPPATDENAWISCGISQDAWILGTRWYSELLPFLREAGRKLLVVDYSANGIPFVSKTPERKIASKNHPVFGNTYFNEVKASRKGMAIVIPSQTPKFIYINPFLSTLDKERIVIKFQGKDYDLGEIPGMTLAVSE